MSVSLLIICIYARGCHGDDNCPPSSTKRQRTEQEFFEEPGNWMTPLIFLCVWVCGWGI
jgi:hypothetical protein